MTPRRARQLLWLSLVLAAPVPILVVGPGWIPVARLAFLGAITSSVLVLESARGAVPLLTVFLLAQATVWATLFWVGAGAVIRLLRPLEGRLLGTATLVLIGGILTMTTLTDAYRDPYRAATYATNLPHLYW